MGRQKPPPAAPRWRRLPHRPDFTHVAMQYRCGLSLLRECCTELCELGMSKLMLAPLVDDVTIGIVDDNPGIEQDDPAPRKDHFGEQAGHRRLISGKVAWGEQRVGNDEMCTLRHVRAGDCVGKRSDK